MCHTYKPSDKQQWLTVGGRRPATFGTLGVSLEMTADPLGVKMDDIQSRCAKVKTDHPTLKKLDNYYGGSQKTPQTYECHFLWNLKCDRDQRNEVKCSRLVELRTDAVDAPP